MCFSRLDSEEKIKSFFEKTFPDAVGLMPDYINEFLHNPTSSLVTVKCFPWTREDKFCLIGDAAHAMVPFFGQGMNCGFEACVVLHELMENFGDDWNKIFSSFQKLRKPDADAISELAIDNFIEMREKVADTKFLLQKKIEKNLYEKYPGKWIPAYSQVTFSPQIRYSEALQNSKKQEAIMTKIMQNDNIESMWQRDEVEKMILQMCGSFDVRLCK